MRQAPRWRQVGVEWVTALAPSRGLLRWWHEGEPTRLRWAAYCARWGQEETQTLGYADAMLRAVDEARARGLLLCCWCADPARCHRRLVEQDVRGLLRLERGCGL